MRISATDARRYLLAAAILCFPFCEPVFGQNIIEDGDAGKTVPSIQITPEQANTVVRSTANFGAPARSEEAKRIRAKVEKHVTEMLEGAPWKPFHHTLGISGYEAYFDHPDELFHTLSIAVPQLSRDTAGGVRRLLARELEKHPPYAINGYDRRAGRPRESYDVPERLRLQGTREAKDHFGVYALWAYSHYASAAPAAKAHWPAVQNRMQQLMTNTYRFDIQKRDYTRDEAEILNGDIAGLIGFVRLARSNGNDAAAEKGMKKLTTLLELRVNLDRVNPRILEKTSASKSLHISKLARYCDLTPEVGTALQKWTDGSAAAYLRAFREARNGWFLAFGDRMIGGENYTNPLHFPRALFAGAMFVEDLPAEQMLGFIDVPWCKGDLYFIEKSVHAIWSDCGRPMEKE